MFTKQKLAVSAFLVNVLHRPVLLFLFCIDTLKKEKCFTNLAHLKEKTF
jgi:hypothetical protein